MQLWPVNVIKCFHCSFVKHAFFFFNPPKYHRKTPLCFEQRESDHLNWLHWIAALMKLEWIQSAEVKGVVGGIKAQRRHLSGLKDGTRSPGKPTSHVQRAQQPFGSCTMLPSDPPEESQMSPSTLDCSPPQILVLCLAREHIPKYWPAHSSKKIKKKALGIFDQPEIWLSQTCFLCATGFMWRALVVTHSWHLFVCVKGSYLSVNGRSSMPGVFTCTRANSSYCLSSSTGTNCPDTIWFIAVFV